jgi:hypothetical protein
LNLKPIINTPARWIVSNNTSIVGLNGITAIQISFGDSLTGDKRTATDSQKIRFGFLFKKYQ